MSVEQEQMIYPAALVEVLREQGEHAAADAVERVVREARVELALAGEPPERADAVRGVMGALERDRARGNVSQWYAA